MAPRGRPRLTPAEYEDRLQAYCRRYHVSATAAGIPPFPAGRRETDQHREWMALYRAHARLSRPPAAHSVSDDAVCGVCGRVVEPGHGAAHRSATLHSGCHQVVTLVEPFGLVGFERLREYLWPAQSRRSPRRQKRPGTLS